MPTHIVVATSDSAFRRLFNELGHDCRWIDRGNQAVELCQAAWPDLLVVDANLPDMSGLDVATAVCRLRAIPIVLISRPDVALSGAGAEHILAHLVQPVSKADLQAAIAVAMRCFHQLRSAREENERLRLELEDRKLVEKAKGLVMRYCQLDEQEAYARLRRTATDTNRKLVEVSRTVLTAGEVFSSLEHPNRTVHSNVHGTRYASV